MGQQKIVYIILGLLFINALWSWVQKDEGLDYGYFKAEHNRLRKELQILDSTLNKQSNDIYNIKARIINKDSIIDKASPGELDSLFIEFFIRTR